MRRSPLMMSQLQLVPAELTGIFAETCIYGIYLVTYAACIYVLVFRQLGLSKKHRKPVNKYLVAASVLLFMAITSHWVINVTRAYHALVKNGGRPNGSLESYGNLADPLNVAKTGLYIVEITIADMIMVYRLWIVWNHNRFVCALPAASVLAFIATGTGITYQFSQVVPGQDPFESECGRWITSSFTLTLCTNMYSSCMLSYKIWDVNRAVRGLAPSSSVMRIIVIVVESAAIYTAISLSTMVGYLAKSNVQFITLNATSPTIGFVFCLITVRVGLGLGHRPVMSTTVLSTTPGVTGVAHADIVKMQPIAVTVKRHVDRRVDSDVLESQIDKDDLFAKESESVTSGQGPED